MRSARGFYRLSLAYAAAGMAAVGVAVVAALPALDLSAAPAHLMAVCSRFLLPVASFGEALLFVAAIVALLVVGLAVRSVARQLRDQRRLRARLDLVAPCSHEQGTAVVVIEDSSVTAFCAGLLRPRVYVSRGALQALREPELDAVLAHERHHAARCDPLRLLGMRVLGDALFMLPAMKRLSRRYGELAELAADEAAVRATGSATPLASALLKFGETPAHGVAGIAPERVDHLLGGGAPWRLPVRPMVVGALGAATLAAAGLTAAAALGSASVSVPEVVARSCMLAMTAIAVTLAVRLVTAGRRPLRAATERVVRASASR